MNTVVVRPSLSLFVLPASNVRPHRWGFVTNPLHIHSRQNLLGDGFHGGPPIHRLATNQPKSLGFADAVDTLQVTLGPLDHHPRREPIAGLSGIPMGTVELGMSRECDRDDRCQVGRRERLHHVPHRPSGNSAGDDIILGEGGHHDHRRSIDRVDRFHGGQSIEAWHGHVEQDEVGLQLRNEFQSPPSIRCLADDLVPQARDHLDDVHPDDGLVFNDHDAGLRHGSMLRATARAPDSLGARPGTPTGRGSRLKLGPVWVRIPPGARTWVGFL